MKTTLLTIALTFALLLGEFSLAVFAMTAPWWCLPMLVVCAFGYGKMVFDLVGMVARKSVKVNG